MRTVLLGSILTLGLMAAGFASTSVSFDATIRPLAASERAKMQGHSWHDGCPVSLDDLLAIRLNYLGFDGEVRDGMLVVHKRVAAEVVEISRELFNAQFRIEEILPYETYPVGEYAEHNDTVGFFCRPAQDNPHVFSLHAYGLAVDINPLTNPYHDPKEGWWPKGSASRSEREREAPGLLTARSAAVTSFMRHGWAWGGFYHDPDYMHLGKVTIGDESNPIDRPVWAERLKYAPN